jgi:hypothetical protein
MGSEGIATCLGDTWRLVVSFTPRPFYLRGKSSQYPLDRKLGGPQSWSRHTPKRKIERKKIKTEGKKKEREGRNNSWVIFQVMM